MLRLNSGQSQCSGTDILFILLRTLMPSLPTDELLPREGEETAFPRTEAQPCKNAVIRYESIQWYTRQIFIFFKNCTKEEPVSTVQSFCCQFSSGLCSLRSTILLKMGHALAMNDKGKKERRKKKVEGMRTTRPVGRSPSNYSLFEPGATFNPTHARWNHSLSQPSASHATISP